MIRDCNSIVVDGMNDDEHVEYDAVVDLSGPNCYPIDAHQQQLLIDCCSVHLDKLPILHDENSEFLDHHGEVLSVGKFDHGLVVVRCRLAKTMDS